MFTLILAVLLAGEPQAGPKKGDPIYISGSMSLGVSGEQMSQLNIPDANLECSGTPVCRYVYHPCDEVLFVKQTSSNLYFRPTPGRSGGSLRIHGNWMSWIFSTREACQSYLDSHKDNPVTGPK